ncbi:MAG: hypothetical protein ACOX87_15195 [Chloroflexota bacterium]
MTGIKGNGAPYELIDPSRQIKVTPLDTTVIVAQVVVRVLVVVTIWLVLCFAIFLGFFTIPLLMLIAFSMVYMLFDLQRVLRKALAAKRKKAESDDTGHSAG